MLYNIEKDVEMNPLETCSTYFIGLLLIASSIITLILRLKNGKQK